MSNVPKNIENVIQDVINGINNLLGDRVKKIILYGSYARGDYDRNSDIDIMILTDLSEEEIIDKRVEIWDMVYDIGLDNDITISPLLKNIDEYNYWLDTLPFYMNVQKEGVILNG
jgi:predicted nucleotidyltransferase